MKNKLDNDKSISELIDSLSDVGLTGKTKIGNLLMRFEETGFAVVMILFSLPIAIPLPYPPGSTAIFGVPLMIFSLQMLFGYSHVFLPKWLANISISNKKILAFSNKAGPKIKKLEKYLKPRFDFVENIIFEKIVSMFSFICAFAISTPVPFTHSLPAWGISIVFLGMLRRDGLVISLGFLVGIFGLFIASLMLIMSYNLLFARF